MRDTVSGSIFSGREAPRRLLGLFSLTVLFCIPVAAVLTVTGATGVTFGRNLLFSECIGLSVFLVSTLIRYLPGVRDLPLRTAILVSLLVALPVGYVIGFITAYLILGEPLHLIALSNSRLAAIVATIFSTGFVFYLAWLKNRLSDEAAARSTAQRLAVEAELRMLRAQLEPHMLFNTLANLRSLIDDEPEDAKQMVDLLIKYLRGALAGSRTDSATLQAEFAQLRAYLEIMTVRLGKRLNYRLELATDLEQARVPSMLMQPLLENAIKHGIEPKVGGGSVAVSARRVDGALELAVVDSGVGFPADQPADEETASYGLVHVRDRLRALYGARASLRLEPQTPTGTRAVVRIPE
jgi:signal transduction histidine kinase